MTGLAQRLGTRASGFLPKKDSPERKALITERNDLAARQWLGTVKTDVLEQIKRLKAVDACLMTFPGFHAKFESKPVTPYMA